MADLACFVNLNLWRPVRAMPAGVDWPGKEQTTAAFASFLRGYPKLAIVALAVGEGRLARVAERFPFFYVARDNARHVAARVGLGGGGFHYGLFFPGCALGQQHSSDGKHAGREAALQKSTPV